MKEIERRFLLDRETVNFVIGHIHPVSVSQINQFYLSTDPERSVRCRSEIINDGTEKSEMTVKGAKVNGAGIEVNVPITMEQLNTLYPLRCASPVVKSRYTVNIGNLFAEIDIFADPVGLILAEVEFRSEEQAAEFTPPAWFGREVTEESSYANAAIAAGSRPEVEIISHDISAERIAAAKAMFGV